MIFDHSLPFDLSLHGKQGAIFVAAFYDSTEFQALATSQNCEQHMSEIIDFIKTAVSSAKSGRIELRIAGNQNGIKSLARNLEKIGISVARKAVRNELFQIRYRPEVGRLEVSADELQEKQQNTGEETRYTGKTKVLIVDDSASVTLLLKKVIESDASMAVVGICGLPSMVADRVEALQPDVITMDIKMPEMDGPTLVKQIYPKYKTPIVMISSISREEGSQVLESLENGAVDYIQKPNLRPISELAELIIPRLKAAANARTNDEIVHKTGTTKLASHWDPSYVIAIGSSTGGVEALKRLLTSFPPNIPPTVIAHHIPSVFSETLSRGQTVFAR